MFVRASSLFTFSHSLGAAYSGVWANPQRIVITIQDANGAGPPPILEFRIQVNFCNFLFKCQENLIDVNDVLFLALTFVLQWYVPSSRYIWSSAPSFCFCKNK